MQTNCYCFYVFLYCDPVVIRIKTKWSFLKVILLFHFQPLLMSNDLRDIDCRSKEILLNRCSEQNCQYSDCYPTVIIRLIIIVITINNNETPPQPLPWLPAYSISINTIIIVIITITIRLPHHRYQPSLDLNRGTCLSATLTSKLSNS